MTIVVGLAAVALLATVGLRLFGVTWSVTSAPVTAGPADSVARGASLPAGYESYDLPEAGRSLTVGQPWRSPCRSVVIVLSGDSSPALVKQTKKVVHEAKRAGVPVVFATAASAGRKMAAPDQTPGRVDLIADPRTPPVNSRGEPSRYLVTGTYQHNADAGENTSKDFAAYVFTRSVGDDSSLMRRIARHVVAAAMGLDPSATAPGSGLTQHLEESIDGFSDEDVDAMLTMAGCPR